MLLLRDHQACSSRFTVKSYFKLDALPGAKMNGKMMMRQCHICKERSTTADHTRCQREHVTKTCQQRSLLEITARADACAQRPRLPLRRLPASSPKLPLRLCFGTRRARAFRGKLSCTLGQAGCDGIRMPPLHRR